MVPHFGSVDLSDKCAKLMHFTFDYHTTRIVFFVSLQSAIIQNESRPTAKVANKIMGAPLFCRIMELRVLREGLSHTGTMFIV